MPCISSATRSFEHGKHNDFSDVPGFIEHRAYGSVNFSLFRAPEDTTEKA